MLGRVLPPVIPVVRGCRRLAAEAGGTGVRAFKRLDFKADIPALNLPKLSDTSCVWAAYKPSAAHAGIEEQDEDNARALKQSGAPFIEKYRRPSQFTLGEDRNSAYLHPDDDFFIGRVWRRDKLDEKGNPRPNHYFGKVIHPDLVPLAQRDVLAAYMGHALGLGDHLMKTMTVSLQAELGGQLSFKTKDFLALRQFVKGQLFSHTAGSLTQEDRQRLIEIDKKPFDSTEVDSEFSRFISLSCFRYFLLGDMDGTPNNMLNALESQKIHGGIFSFDHEQGLQTEKTRELLNQIKKLTGTREIPVGGPYIGTLAWMRQQVERSGHETWLETQYYNLGFPMLRGLLYKEPLSKLSEGVVPPSFLRKIVAEKEKLYSLLEAFQIFPYATLSRDYGQASPGKCETSIGQAIAIVEKTLQTPGATLTEGDCVTGCAQKWDRLKD